MIHCAFCGTTNEPDEDVCSNCGRQLLPGFTKQDRMQHLGFSVLLLVAGPILYLMAFGAAHLPGILAWLAIPLIGLGSYALIGFIGMLGWGVLRPNFLVRKAERHNLRAKRHVGIDPEQAERDFDMAVALDPTEYLSDRAEFYIRQDRLESALLDLQRALRYHANDGKKSEYNRVKRKLASLEQAISEREQTSVEEQGPVSQTPSREDPEVIGG